MHSPETVILKRLYRTPEEFTTGSELAALLGVSRVAVWSSMKKLRRDGFVFDAVRNRGYRVRTVPHRLCLPYLLHHLDGSPAAEHLVFQTRTGSTNRDAEGLLAEGRTTPFTVLSRRQSEGRGRLGRSWNSAEEGNLYASFAFRPELPPERMQPFTLWMGLTVCRTLAEETGIAPGIKWPNDIWHGGKKMGGILTEAKVNADQILSLVLGLGLNLNSQPSAWDLPLSREATSLQEILGRPCDINALTGTLIRRIENAYEAFRSEDFRPGFPALWDTYDILRDREVTGKRGTETFHGRARGIDRDGNLMVETKRGSLVRLNAGDVTLGGSRGSPAASGLD